MYQFKSSEEKHFSWFLDDLIDHGYAKQWWYEPKTYVLSEDIKYDWVKETQLKTKLKVENKESTFLRGHVYTPDFCIKWDHSSVDKLWSSVGLTRPLHGDKHGYSFIDTKGSFDPHNMTRLFRINQKWMWDKLGIYVQDIVPQKLFEKTFTPQRYLMTDKMVQKRNIKWKVKTVTQYMNEG